ncbi:uncharacterized protein LOC108911409 [Anoplophora glabripennis]|uniref:uncharacterized protein LOC108911409 n=1 Tax=Anoplophora glabripennis TaxID=217634 RepID=UPI000873CB37|nr:uncharacterized protein LOC108911409 [Anoplophora glabripennis]
MFVVLLVASLITSTRCNGKVTDKQYASMPLVFHQDNFDRCMLLEENALYCSFTFELEPLNPSNASETWNIISIVDREPKTEPHLVINTPRLFLTLFIVNVKREPHEIFVDPLMDERESNLLVPQAQVKMEPE